MRHTDQATPETAEYRRATVSDPRLLSPAVSRDRRWIGRATSWLFNCILEGFAAHGQAMYPYPVDLSCGYFGRQTNDQRWHASGLAPSPEADVHDEPASEPSRHQTGLRWPRPARELQMLDDRMLRDIGVEPYQIGRALQRFERFRW
jgi:uncharacterized protein YjiS (DUF1127 family)